MSRVIQCEYLKKIVRVIVYWYKLKFFLSFDCIMDFMFVFKIKGILNESIINIILLYYLGI